MIAKIQVSNFHNLPINIFREVRIHQHRKLVLMVIVCAITLKYKLVINDDKNPGCNF